MYNLIPIQNKNYPKRLSCNKLFYTEYKQNRPFFFHDSIKNDLNNESLVPTLNDFKDKISYITNEYILDSNLFEYCDYFINYIEGEELSSAMLPLNPFSPTGIGGKGLLKKWGPNHISVSIIITFDINNNCYQLLVVNKDDNYFLPSGEIEHSNVINSKIYNKLKNIIDIKNAHFIFSGYSNDSKNTDHAWIEKSAYLFNLTNIQRINLLKYLKNNIDCNFKLININKENYKLLNINDLFYLNLANNFF
tara:strand:+ start:6107 stop:6853 length:747 start_codon:yes stop_codon:yes gene_type:complete